MDKGQPDREGPGFLDRLADWPPAGEAVQAFERMVNRPLTAPAPRFHAALYHALVDFLLRRLALPRSAGAAEWEWRALYRFGEEVNPFYFTEGEVHALLGQWPALSIRQRGTLAAVLGGYLELRRGGFPADYPSRLVGNGECERWLRVFPPEWGWSPLGVLHRVGLDPMGSWPGYRAWVRFSEGRFAPGPEPEGLRRWQAECWRAERYGPAEDGVAPYRAGFVGAVFAGRYEALGLAGVCGEVPDCPRCPLQAECRWHAGPPEAAPEPAALWAQARLDRAQHLETGQLLQGLFDLDEAGREALERALAGTTLRRLAGLSQAELEARLDGVGLAPAKLRLLFELCRRFNEERLAVGVSFQTPWDIFRHFRMRMRDLRQERFIVVLLDNKKRYLADHVVTQGTLDASPVHPREVFNAAIRESAASLVIVHNHPSGDATPSRDDVEVTRQLMAVGRLVGIPVIDHVIIADDRYTSLRERGAME